MRRFELALTFIAVFAIAWPVVFGVRPRRGIAGALVTAGFIAQLQLEGYRWQLIPLYAVVIGLAIGDVIFIDRKLAWTNRLARGVFGLAGLALVVALPIVLPVPELPVPSGTLPIGTITVELVDTERPESYGSTPGGPRRFMVQVWYPAEPFEEVEPTPWAQDWDVVAPAMARRLGLPSWFLGHTAYTDSHASVSLPLAQGSFPVVMYSHGWTGSRAIAVNQIETLVSNGYVVIAPDHTYAAVATRLSGGEIVGYDPAALPPADEVGEEAHLSAANALIETLAADLVRIVDELEKGADGSLATVASAVDLTRVGVYGHSSGGGAAIRFCLLDERCDAVLGLDPWVEPLDNRVIRETPRVPSLFVRSDDWRGTENDSILRGLAARSEEVTYLVGVEGSGHNDFVATPLLSPVAAQLGLKGPIPAGRIIPILDNYLIGFFDVFLLGTGSAALDEVSFREVAVEVIVPS